MDARTFEAIKNKIDTLKSKKAKAEGAMENIEAQWKSEHGISTLKEAADLLKFMEGKQADMEDEIKEFYSELEGLTNWSLV